MKQEETRPKLTDPQAHRLGRAIEVAYFRWDWDGRLRSQHSPAVRDSTMERGGASVTTIKALLRAGVIEPATNGVHPLTALGVKLGEQEAKERTGELPAERAKRDREEKQRAARERAEEVADLVAPFKGIRITRKLWREKGKRVDLAELLTKILTADKRVEFTEAEIGQIAAQITKR